MLKRLSAGLISLILVSLLAGCRGMATQTEPPAAAPGSPAAPTATPPARSTPTLAAATAAPASPQETPAPQGSLRRDVTYCTVDSTALKMDIYTPAGLTKPMPAILYVHGGGWTSGNKAEAAAFITLVEKAGLKYVLASANYRLAPEDKFPAQIQDVLCAVRFLRANATELWINPEQIGAWGSSAGGHLVSLLGTLDDPSVFASHNGITGSREWSDQPENVQAVLDFFGPVDLTNFIGGSANLRSLGSSVFGVTDPDDPWLATISPVTYANGNEPPFLIMHGDQDTVVPLSQSQALYDRLGQAGSPVELVVVEGAGHGFPPGARMNPSFDELSAKIASFFRAALGE